MTLRSLLLALLVPSVAAWTASEARAHGGNFRQGGGAPVAVPIPEGDEPTRARVTTERATWLAGDWQVWWRLNRDGLLPDKRAVRRRANADTASSSIFVMGDAGTSGLDGWEQDLRAGALQDALPYLLEILDPRAETQPALVSAGLVALGRIARDRSAVRVLQRHAVDERQCVEVRESAVLGLGLLRRTTRKERLDTETLGRIRRFLIALFDDKDVPTRVRAFAAIAIGLLADQPYPDTALERDGRYVTRELWQRLRKRYSSGELPVALLTALGRQPRKGVASGVLQGLRAIAGGKPFRGHRWNALRRSHAMTAYARLDGPGWLPLALWSMRGTHDHLAVRAASAIAIAERAGEMDSAERRQAARSLLRCQPKEPHWFVRGVSQVALGFLLREDLRRGRRELLADMRLGTWLCRETTKGRSLTRPFSALAVGLSVYRLEPRNKSGAIYLKEARSTLEKGLRRGKGSDEQLGAWAVGLGLAGSTRSLRPLLKILQDRHRGPGLRGHCAIALAQLGLRTPRVIEALHAAAEERASPTVHVQAVRALALLAPPETTPRLLEQMERTKARHAVAVVAGAVGSFGDPAASKRLLEMARGEETPLVVRTMCVVALGLIFDPEPRPSRMRITAHANYPSRTASLAQAFNIM